MQLPQSSYFIIINLNIMRNVHIMFYFKANCDINANLSLGKRWKGGRALWLLVVYHLATLQLISYIKSGNPCLLSLSQHRTKSFSFPASSRSVKTSKINPPPPPCSSRPWNCYHQTLCLCVVFYFSNFASLVFVHC